MSCHDLNLPRCAVYCNISWLHENLLTVQYTLTVKLSKALSLWFSLEKVKLYHINMTLKAFIAHLWGLVKEFTVWVHCLIYILHKLLSHYMWYRVITISLKSCYKKVHLYINISYTVKYFHPGQNGHHFADDILNAFHEWQIVYFDSKFASKRQLTLSEHFIR